MENLNLAPRPALYLMRHGTRVIHGAPRKLRYYTFTGTPDQYGAFLDLRTDAGGELRKGPNAPTVEIDGRPEWASFEVRE